MPLQIPILICRSPLPSDHLLFSLNTSPPASPPLQPPRIASGSSYYENIFFGAQGSSSSALLPARFHIEVRSLLSARSGLSPKTDTDSRTPTLPEPYSEAMHPDFARLHPALRFQNEGSR